MSLDLTIPWAYGVTPRSLRTVAPTDLPLSVDHVTEFYLKSPNGSVEDELVESLIIAATEQAESMTQLALMPQTWTLMLEAFPASGTIVLPRPPLIGYPTIEYYDGDEVVQTLSGSPALFDVGTSGRYALAQIRPLSGASFPSTFARMDAVTITYRAGFSDENDPRLTNIKVGIGIKVRDMYDGQDKGDQYYMRFWPKVGYAFR